MKKGLTYPVIFLLAAVLGIGGAVASRTHNGQSPLPSPSDYATQTTSQH